MKQVPIPSGGGRLAQRPARLARLGLGILFLCSALGDRAPSAERDSADARRGDRDAQATLRESVRYLSSDELEGRGVGTRGLELAAEYVARQFSAIGLRTDCCGGGAFQDFMRRSHLDLGATNQVSLVSPGGERIELELRKDFTPLSLSGSGRFDLPLVFVGYGITDRAAAYDDYAGIDARGKAVVVLRHEPQRSDPRSVFNGEENSENAFFGRKITNAIEHGAAAVILCTDHHEIAESAREKRAEAPKAAPNDPELDPLLGFRVRTQLGSRDVPVVHCRRAFVERVVQAVLGSSLRDLEREIDDGPAPRSRELTGWRIAGEVSVLEKGKSLKNVVGLLEGEGALADETIVIGAHYDHLGYGGWGSLAWTSENEIHNGADDNASGTAVLIEVAKRLASAKKTPRRQVLFIAFSAEEMGLLGSAHYVREPVVPLRRTVAMLNLDMVGRLRNNRLSIQGTGTAAMFDPLIDAHSARYSLEVAKQRGGYGPSDHTSFYERGIPVLHFFTGLHADYHRPSDDYEKLNLDGMERIAGFVADVALALATSGERPQLSRPELNLAENPRAQVETARRPRHAYLGVTADQSRETSGYTVARVTPGSPAQYAGLQQGDIIVRLGDDKLTASKDLPIAVAKHKPGAKVAVTLVRDGIELEFEIVLAARP
jgi:hypothetical protein